MTLNQAIALLSDDHGLSFRQYLDVQCMLSAHEAARLDEITDATDDVIYIPERDMRNHVTAGR